MVAKEKDVTCRGSVMSEIKQFLGSEGLGGSAIVGAVTQLVDKLAHYREEGEELSPDIFLCKSIREVAARIGGADSVTIGRGQQDEATVRKALKECAMLTREKWAVFFQIEGAELAYGVFRPSSSPLSLTAEEVLIEEGGGDISVAMISKIAENVVELRGARKNRRGIYFSTEPAGRASSRDHVGMLAEDITRHVSEDVREDAKRFIYHSLLTIVQQTHGCLIVVLEEGVSKLPEVIDDAVKLDVPHPVAQQVLACLQEKNVSAMARLEATAELMRGMLKSDGITVFNESGFVIAYRAFMHRERMSKERASTGGARRRTYEGLKQLVDKREVVSAFFRSQDGETEYCRRVSND